tara:strand:+ start:4060 stop:5154 length:1095 start_codon:yes stop_codon:yes gene_type:complete
MDIGKAIYKILSDNIAVSSMVGTRISPNVMKQTSPFPFIVYDVSSAEPEGQKDSVALLDTVDVMVSAYCKTYSEASKLANYIRTALDRVNGVYNAVNIQAIDFDGYDDVFDDMSGSDGIYRKSLNFNVRVINSFNNIYSTLFDGVDDFVSLGVSGFGAVKNHGSISAWFKLETTSASGDIMRIFEDSNNNIRVFYHNPSSELRCVYKAGGITTSAVLTDVIEGDGNWHHVVGTWDNNTGDAVAIYLDGVLKQSTSGVSGTFTGTFTSASIGNNAEGGGFWKGNIDEVVLFNKALDSTEVSDLYNDGLPFNPQPLNDIVGYWKMGDGGIVGNPIATFPTIVDEIGNHNGTMTNMTSTDFVADVPE